MKPGSRVSLFGSWTVDDRVARKLEGTCFLRFIGFPLYQQKHMFLEEIARSYSKLEHTFVVGNTHLYLGLEDVYYLSGLPVDGRPIVCEVLENPTSLCRRLLDGKDDPGRKLTVGKLRCTWLKETFELVPQGIENEQLDVYVRAYVLFIIGTMLLSDGDKDRVAIHYLQFIENLHPNSLNGYAWGVAVLARLHQSLQLTKKSIRGASWILELFFLERVPSVGIAYLKEQPELTKKFPAFVEWGDLLCKASKNKRMTIDWGHIFESIQAEEIKWTPYQRFSGIDKQRIFYSRTILFDFEKIIYHMPEQAPLQLSINCMQEPLKIMLKLKENSRNGYIDKKLLHHYKAYIKEWCEHRYDAETCIIGTDEGFVLPNPPSEPSSAFDDTEGCEFLRLPTWEGRDIDKIKPNEGRDEDSEYEMHQHTTNPLGPNEPISELTSEQPSVERFDSKVVREKERKKDRDTLEHNSVNKRKTQETSKGPEGESSKKKSLRKSVAQRSKKATKTDGQDSGDDLEDTILDVRPLSEMGSNCEDDVERNHEDDDGEDPNGSGSDYDGEKSKENDDAADKNDDDGEGDKGGDGERDDDGHSTEGGDNYIPLDITQASSHPENETHACLSKQASGTPLADQDAIPPADQDKLIINMSVFQDMLTHLATPAEKKFQQTLSNRQSIQRSYSYLGASASSSRDTLQRFEKLIADLEELVHTNDLNEWEKVEYRKSFLSTSKKLQRMTVKKEEAVEKCHGLETVLASTDARNKKLEQQLQDVTESNKQQELQLKNQFKDLEGKDREIARLKEELRDSIIRAGDQEKQKQNVIRDLVPAVLNRLLRSAEYKASIGNAFSFSYGAGYVEGVKVDRSDDDVKKVLARTNDLDLDSKEKFLKAYHELFTHQYPFVDKVSSAFRLPLVDVLAIQPNRPDEGSSTTP